MRLVVDASVAFAAGEADNPTSMRCSACLEYIAAKDGIHQVVMTKEIEEEWKDITKPRSRIAYKWLRRLQGAKKVEWLNDVRNDELRERVERLERHPIDRSDITATLRKEMLEDIHLIEAALATDKTLLSLDKQVRRHFKLFLPQLPELEAVIWENPAEADEVLVWLKGGAPPDERRMLGYRSND